MYAILKSFESDLRLPESCFKDGVLQPNLSLQAFYILGSTPHTLQASARDACIHLLIPVQQETEQITHDAAQRLGHREGSSRSQVGNEERQSKFTYNSLRDFISVYCCLYSTSGCPMIHRAPFGSAIAFSLVRGSESKATPPPAHESEATPPLAQDALLWLAEEM